MYNIVTIERRYASGGNEIGKKLADALGYKLYDRNILIKAAKNLEIPYFQIEDLDESTAGGILMNLAKTGLGGLSGNRELPLADKLLDRLLAVGNHRGIPLLLLLVFALLAVSHILTDGGFQQPPGKLGAIDFQG